MLAWSHDAARDAGCDVLLIVHHQEEAVRAALPEAAHARQEIPRGTGDAVRAAGARLEERSTVLVLPGDAPLVESDTLRALLAAHGENLCTMLTCLVEEPGAYGRVVRDGKGCVRGVVEVTEASAVELALREVNAGIYAFDARWLATELLPSLLPHPPKHELYLTDAVAAAAARGALGAMLHGDARSLMGVNDRHALSEAEEVLQARILRRHAEQGVTLRRPSTIRVEATVEIDADVVLEQGVVLEGRTRVGRGARVGVGCVLRDTEVGEDCILHPYTVAEGARIGAGCRVGPMARLRQDTVLEPNVHVGNFVETKNSLLEVGAKANHLSYLGDARVGAGSNVGAGTITCNYDGFRKSRTDIGAGAFIGSNTALVAPVRVGDGAIVGAGSVIVDEVPDNAVAIARGAQVNHEGRAEDLRAALSARAGRASGK
jgi:bifunctional UDP-N-acetylglucosamine pyrophosphorylase/glucosamine-1-phosphate N-acetyltransferase